MSQIKEGDKVRCITAGANRYLTDGKVYIVEKVRNNSWGRSESLIIRINNIPFAFFPSRFVKDNREEKLKRILNDSI